MRSLFCVNPAGISTRLAVIQAKICAWKRCLECSVKPEEAERRMDDLKIAISELDTSLTQNAKNSKLSEKTN